MKQNKKEPAYKSERDPRFMTVDELKDRWGLQPETIRRYSRSGLLPTVRFGGRLHFNREVVAAFEYSHRVGDWGDE